MLQTHAPEIAERVARPVQVAELGSGSGKKTRWILEALSQTQETFYYPIELSPAALEACEKELGNIDMVSIVGYERTYLDGLRAVAGRRGPGDHLLVLFLGSTIGNFDRDAGEEFLKEIRSALQPGDSLLLGTDLVKDLERQLLAYNDPTGVTAAFNKNLLARLNRELNANFDLSAFEHEARWDASERRIEMHLVSKKRQKVEVPGANVQISLFENETIWTESSHKYFPREVGHMAARTGFREEAQWIDQEWPFAQNLWVVA